MPLVAAAVTVLGVGLLLWAVRGRRLSGAVLCGVCGRRWEPAEVTCSDCGTARSRRGAVINGVVRSRPWATVGAALLLALGLPATAGWVYAAATAPLRERKPVWLLRWELGSAAASVAEGAAGEVRRRAGERLIAGEEVIEALMETLNADASRDAFAVVRARSLMEELSRQGRLSPLKQRWLNMRDATLTVEPVTGSIGESVPAWIAARYNGPPQTTMPVIVTPKRLRVGGAVLDLPSSGSTVLALWAESPPLSSVWFVLPAAVKSGQHEATLELEMTADYRGLPAGAALPPVVFRVPVQVRVR